MGAVPAWGGDASRPPEPPAVPAWGGDPPKPPAVPAWGGDPPEPPAVPAWGGDPPKPPAVPAWGGDASRPPKPPAVPAHGQADADARRLRRARAAIAVIFFSLGALFGNWVTRIPAIKEHVGAGTGPLGLALLGFAVSALVVKPAAGQLVARFGSGQITRAGIALSCLTLPLPALAPSVVTLGLALVGFGASMGVLDVAMNAHAVAVQEQLGRPVMSSFHGVYSIGGLTGALAGGRAGAWGLSPLLHFTIVAAVLGCAALAASSWLLPPAPDAARQTRKTRQTAAGGWARLPRDFRLTLLLLGLVGLCSMVAEGAAGDWSAIYLHDNLGTSVGFASWGYAAYSIAMAAGRLLGDRFVGRWGGLRVVTWSATLAGGGFALALVARNPAAAICGLAVLGIGLSAVIPVVFSMAGKPGGDTAGAAIAVVAAISGTGLLAGPPMIGFLAEAVGLPVALAAVSVLAFAAAGLARVVNARTARTGLRPRVLLEPSAEC